MARHRNGGKKNQHQAHQYREFVANMDLSPEGTTTSTNSMLVGTCDTNADQERLHGNEEILRTPFKYRFIDWVRKNLFAEIIIAIVLGIGTFTVSHMVKIAVIEQRIEHIEKQLENIDDDYVDKEYVASQLELFRTEITGDNKLSIKEIDWQLKNIENRLDVIEDNKQ